MSAPPTDSLLLDLLEWVAARPRPYAELMDAWRTSCPRLPVWEEAVTRGLVERLPGGGGEPMVRLRPAGRRLLREAGRSATAAKPSPATARSRPRA